MYVNCALHSVTLYSQQMGGRKRLNVRHPLASLARLPRCNSFVKCASVQTGRRRRKKKSEAKPSGTVCRTPLGVDKVPQNPHRSDKIMSFF